jgi:antitoxin PrlF
MAAIVARLSAKAQTVIPKPIREKLGVGAGDAILFEERDGEIVIRAARRGPTDDPFAVFTEWAGDADERAYADF